MQDKDTVKLDLRVVPAENGTYIVTFEAQELPSHIAEHLCGHLQDAVQEFLVCTGGVGKAYREVIDKKTGQTILSEESDFGLGQSLDRKSMTPIAIDPKKVN